MPQETFHMAHSAPVVAELPDSPIAEEGPQTGKAILQTMKTLEEMIEVMQAARDGKQIEFCPRSHEHRGPWTPTSDPTWNWKTFDYRVAPEPWEEAWKVFRDTPRFCPEPKSASSFRAGFEAGMAYRKEQKCTE